MMKKQIPQQKLRKLALSYHSKVLDKLWCIEANLPYKERAADYYPYILQLAVKTMLKAEKLT